MSISTLKKEAFAHLSDTIEQKIQTAKEEIESARISIVEDTKSSAGDKYETNREMMQAEMSRNEMNLAKALTLKDELNRINLEAEHKQVAIGSMVVTQNGTYFLSIGIGVVQLENEKIFCISEASPIGALLIGKKVGDSIDFRGQKISIKQIG